NNSTIQCKLPGRSPKRQRKPAKSEGMRHATFTLTPQCIEKLANIAQKTGKAKSALIREWIENNSIN
ncbi:MAG: hypothetical protein QGF15_08400, partial [Alteromonas macleodii]|nr:hypothetical protein [Alteromonas macleodii]